VELDKADLHGKLLNRLELEKSAAATRDGVGRVDEIESIRLVSPIGVFVNCIH
jgi:hypothetical protein